jgi:CxxC motif-containing protein
MLPVRTTAPIPKERIMDAAEAVRAMTLTAPIKCGEVLEENFLGTGVMLVSAMSLQ